MLHLIAYTGLDTGGMTGGKRIIFFFKLDSQTVQELESRNLTSFTCQLGWTMIKNRLKKKAYDMLGERGGCHKSVIVL